MPQGRQDNCVFQSGLRSILVSHLWRISRGISWSSFSGGQAAWGLQQVEALTVILTNDSEAEWSICYQAATRTKGAHRSAAPTDGIAPRHRVTSSLRGTDCDGWRRTAGTAGTAHSRQQLPLTASYSGPGARGGGGAHAAGSQQLTR